MKHGFIIGALVGLAVVASPAAAKTMPTTWDGLVRVQSKRMDYVYLQPGADFRGYTKILMDTPEVTFQKNWKRDYNSSSRGLSERVSDRDVQEAISRGVTAAQEIFSGAFTQNGYAIVTSPGPDVLRVRTGILDVRVTAPDRATAGRSYTFSQEAGSATLFVEARDSLTGSLLGRAVHNEVLDDNFTRWRTAVSNRGDFRDLVGRWASISARGLNELKSRSPIAP